MGLQLNAPKKKILTTQAQPPSPLHTPNGLTISILDNGLTISILDTDDVNGTDRDM